MADASKPTKDDVIALETAYWEAMKKKDGARTAELSGDPALVIGAQGVSRIAKKAMGAMTEEGKWTLNSYAFEEMEVSVPTPDVAIVAYVVSQNVTMDGKTQDMRAAENSTWIRGADGWECHAHSEASLNK